MHNFPIDAVRSRFPALRRQLNGVSAVHFDAPGGTQACDATIDAMAAHLTSGSANSGGVFWTSVETDRVSADAHAAMADLLGAKPDDIAFGPNMTSLTFAVSRALAQDWTTGDELIVTRLDHDANIAPWLRVAEDRAMTVRWLDFDPRSGRWDAEELRALLSSRTRLVALGVASNALGTLNPIADAARVIRTHSNALIYVDAVQSVPHVATDVAALDCDFLACSPYKFFGPHQGVLWMRPGIANVVRAYKVRPACDKGARGFETGTPSFEGQAGVLGAICYLEWLGGHVDPYATTRRAKLVAAMVAIAHYERALGERLLSGLATIRGLKLWGPPTMDGRVPTFAMTIEGHQPEKICRHLAARGIFAWAGHFYALEVIDRLALADAGGLLRVGLCHYSSAAEIDRLIEALADL